MGSEKLSLNYRVKSSVVSISLLTLGVTFENVSKGSSEMKKELDDWGEGRTVAIGVLPDGPLVAIRKGGGGLTYLGKGDHGADLKILFKNTEVAFLILTGQINAAQAFSEHRAIVHGSLDHAMQANRAMAIAQKFLFPKFMLNKGMKRPPTFTTTDVLLKIKIMATLGVALLLNMKK